MHTISYYAYHLNAIGVTLNGGAGDTRSSLLVHPNRPAQRQPDAPGEVCTAGLRTDVVCSGVEPGL